MKFLFLFFVSVENDNFLYIQLVESLTMDYGFVSFV